MNKFFKPDTADIFIASKCNLNCSYCYISKNKSFSAIDKDIRKALEDGTYFESLKEFYKDDYGELETLELWGGEPMLGLSLFVKNMLPYIVYFKNLHTIAITTNLTQDIKPILELIEKLKFHKERKFVIKLNVSMDGHPAITDVNRGEGTSKLIEKNLLELLGKLDSIDLINVKVSIGIKSTLSADNVRDMLTRFALMDYYRYFNNLSDQCILACGNPLVKFYPGPLPTFVAPGQYTTQDGLDFAQLLRLMGELEEENKQCKHFIYYKKMAPLTNLFSDAQTVYDEGIKNRIGFCGAFRSKVNIMHTGDMNICHRGFLEFFDTYREDSYKEQDLDTRKVYTLRKSLSDNAAKQIKANRHSETFSSFEEKMRIVYQNNKLQLSALMATIYELAKAGQADKIYLESEAHLIRAAVGLRMFVPCLYDNILLTGSYHLRDLTTARLLCNGAMEYLFEKAAKEEQDELSGRE